MLTWKFILDIDDDVKTSCSKKKFLVTNATLVGE